MWFDIVCLQDPSHRKELQLQGMAESARDLLDLIRQELETSKISPENIVLGGLSQGCAMSLSVLLCLDRPIGGFIGMSGYLPFREDIDEAMAELSDDEDNPFSHSDDIHDKLDPATKASVFERDLLGLPPVDDLDGEKTAQSTPIFVGHGGADEKVPCSLGEAMARTMQTAGYTLRWKYYQGHGHWYKIPDEIDDIVEFLRCDVGWQVEDTEAA
ncbi:Acyl-protein thioesterase 1 [Tolypocladium ophioglossoides CBS 100239]|uniref:Acyl-protein thioesterase 1 n=1 Tax=Tolypocladium ophioglossoides (strain CBS 100239) TaxID=1163406 RepID=A0A0L0N5Z0_TOLOC|nr:Acyl-protein thioesterase 1 [Tolypocladium ophioglossoides CBS 100239]